MKILILGGSGFVGGHLARRLSRDEHEIDVATRHAPRARRLRVIPRVSVRAFDPYDVDRLVREVDGHDAVINLVGILNERGRDGSGFRRAHVELPEIAVEACRRAGVRRFVQMSALNAGRDDSHYLATRGDGDRRVADSGLDWTIFRPSTIFGPDDRFLNRFERLLALSPVLPLARPDARMAPVFVGDVADAFANALADRGTVGRTFELCGPDTWRLREIVEWVAGQRGLKRWIAGLPDALGRIQAAVFDFVPGKPFSSDNFRSLGVDSVCGENGFGALGIDPWAMDEKAGEWLSGNGRHGRFRRFREAAGRGGTGR
jgi:NADH dehydrogenase